MALSHGRLLSFYVSTPSGGASASLSTSTQEVNGLPGDQDTGDVTVAGMVGHASYPGLQKASFTTKHTMDDATGGAWYVLGAFQNLQQTYPTVPWGIIFGPRGISTGCPKIYCSAWIKSIALPIKVTDPNLMTVSWEMTGGTTGATISTFA